MSARSAALLAFLANAALGLPARSQTNPSPAPSLEDYARTVQMEAASGTAQPASHALIAPLHAQWAAEHDPAKRSALASQLLEAIIHDYGEEPGEIADELARNGLPEKDLTTPAVSAFPLQPIFVLPGAHPDEMNAPGVPVFRRIAADRLEAWVPKEGWLFDAKGRLVADAHVPRRDGTGREWFGAFLSDGRWITTDLWENDHQLTFFDQQGDPNWELPGREVVAKIDQLNQPADANSSPEPSCGWARADRTGRRWLVSMGTNWSRGLALLTPSRKMTPLRNDANMWQLVYPRSMGYRGMFISLFMESDDGQLTVSREEAGHGVGVGWPSYTLAARPSRLDGSYPAPNFNVTIHDAMGGFGFWPKSHAVYIHSGYGEEPDRVWFFSDQGRYEGEVTGHPLGEAANGRDLLVQTNDGTVVTLHHAGEVNATAARRFTWPDGSAGAVLSLYDDLRLGFFLRSNGANTAGHEAQPIRSDTDIVLARW